MTDDLGLFLWALRARRNRFAMCVASMLIGFAGGSVAARLPVAKVPADKLAAASVQYAGHPWERIVLLDNSFSQTERGEIVYGFDQWVMKLGERNAHLRYGLIVHDTAESAASVGTIHVVRRPNMKDIPGCETAIGCYQDSTHRVLIDADDLNINIMPLVAAHELGHAMGLDDVRDGPAGSSVMMWSTGGAAPFPTDRDAAMFCKINGCTKLPSEWETL